MRVATASEDELRQGRTILVVQPERRAHLAKSLLAANGARTRRTVERETFAQQLDRA